MKKIMLIWCFILGIASAQAQEIENCAGKLIKKQNGHVYCFSNVDMNWYSAHAWCDAQGRHLATMNEACDYALSVYGSNYSTGCPNATSAQFDNTDSGYRLKFWVNRQDEEGKAFWVGLFYSEQEVDDVTSASCRALCY